MYAQYLPGHRQIGFDPAGDMQDFDRGPPFLLYEVLHDRRGRNLWPEREGGVSTAQVFRFTAQFFKLGDVGGARGRDPGG